MKQRGNTAIELEYWRHRDSHNCHPFACAERISLFSVLRRELATARAARDMAEISTKCLAALPSDEQERRIAAFEVAIAALETKEATPSLGRAEREAVGVSAKRLEEVAR